MQGPHQIPFRRIIDTLSNLFGIGAGTAKFRFERNNVGWYPARVRMEFTEGVYQAVTANYDGNGQLYGIGLNYLDK